jgi:HK97 family phage prohead protease
LPHGTELKILEDSGTVFTVGGYGVVFGGQDITGDRFTDATDFWLDRITATPPVLYQHGQNDTLKRTVVGRVTSTQPDDIGLWVEAQITAAKKYADAIRTLISKGVLGWSSGSVPHLVQRVKSATAGVAEITSWPIVELSLTPTPAEPRTIGIQELKALAKIEPLLSDIAEAAVKAAKSKPQRSNAAVDPNSLPDSAFAFVEPGGAKDDEQKTVPRATRHFAHHAADGSVDSDLLEEALHAAERSKHGAKALAHLLTHTKGNDAHATEWSEGAIVTLILAHAQLGNLIDDVAKNRQAMDQLGQDSKGGERLHQTIQARIKALEESLGQVRGQAESIDRGDDGRLRVEMFRHKLAMLELEEVS